MDDWVDNYQSDLPVYNETCVQDTCPLEKKKTNQTTTTKNPTLVSPLRLLPFVWFYF